MCFGLIARSLGPCTEPTRSPAACVTDLREPRANDSSASRRMAEREALRRRAISVNCWSSSSGSLIETTRIAERVLPMVTKGNTNRGCGQLARVVAPERMRPRGRPLWRGAESSSLLSASRPPNVSGLQRRATALRCAFCRREQPTCGSRGESSSCGCSSVASRS